MAMSPYPSYIETDIGWFQKIPEHWSLIRLKWTNDDIKNGVWGGEKNGIDDLVCIRVADFDRSKLLVDDSRLTLRSIEEKERAGRLLERGDLLLEKSGGGEMQLVGAVIQFDKNYDAVTSNFIARLSVASDFFSRYLTYLHAYLYSINLTYRSIKQSTGIQNLDSGLYFNEVIAIPGFEEQTKIAYFLDYKTTQIDRLIEKKKALIEKLNEQRISLITQAVTKGLNPDVTMKNSDVEWLGDIPDHWTVKRAKFVSTVFVPQRNKPKLNSVKSGLPWITMDDMYSDEVCDSKMYVSDVAASEAESKSLIPGAVIASCVGSFGVVAINKTEVVINQQLQAFIPTKISGKFLQNVVVVSKHYFELVGTAATLKYVNSNGFDNLPVPTPPDNEQQEIIDYLDMQTKKIDKIVAINQQTIEKLEEYRTALITAAVTGKIDVRNVEIPDQDAA